MEFPVLGKKELNHMCHSRDEITTTPFLHLRYERTDCALMCVADPPTTDSCRHGDFEKSFTERLSKSLKWNNCLK